MILPSFLKSDFGYTSYPIFHTIPSPIFHTKPPFSTHFYPIFHTIPTPFSFLPPPPVFSMPFLPPFSTPGLSFFYPRPQFLQQCVNVSRPCPPGQCNCARILTCSNLNKSANSMNLSPYSHAVTLPSCCQLFVVYSIIFQADRHLGSGKDKPCPKKRIDNIDFQTSVVQS